MVELPTTISKMSFNTSKRGEETGKFKLALAHWDHQSQTYTQKDIFTNAKPIKYDRIPR